MPKTSTKGMILSVYRHPDRQDCTNQGISSKHDELLLVEAIDYHRHHSVPRIFEANGRPLVMLHSHCPGIVCIRPLDPLNTSCAMFGGNYASPEDSRVIQLIERLTGHPWHGAIPIHDRYED